jgi:hypothetical protein
VADPVIVCPTFARAGNIKAFGAFGDDLLLIVAQRQLDEYRAAHPTARFDCHPDSLGGLSLVRQWIYDKYGDVFMVDDDVPAMYDYTDKKACKVEPARAQELVHRMADMAEEMGAFLYGPSEERNPLRFQPHKPFRLTGVVRGRAMGLRAGAKFFWPTDPSVDDEMCLSGLNAYYHRFCLVDCRYAMPGDEYSVGGLAARRTQQTIVQWVGKLKLMFGDAVSAQAMGDAKLKIPW